MTKLRPHYFRIQDLNVSAVVAGQGPLILFFHGFGESWQWWRPSLEALWDRFSVCAVDLPGWGNSSPLRSNTLPDPHFYKEYVTRILEYLSLGPAVVVGRSLGGYVAVQAAIQNTPGIRGVALVASAGFGPVHNKLLRLLSLPIIGEILLLSGHAGLRIFLRSLVGDSRSISSEMIRLATLSPVRRERFLDQLRTGVHIGRTSDALILQKSLVLTIPTLLVWGRHDSVFPFYHAYRAQKVLSVGDPVILEHSGHLPQLEEQGPFNDELRRFAMRVHGESSDHVEPTLVRQGGL